MGTVDACKSDITDHLEKWTELSARLLDRVYSRGSVTQPCVIKGGGFLAKMTWSTWSRGMNYEGMAGQGIKHVILSTVYKPCRFMKFWNVKPRVLSSSPCRCHPSRTIFLSYISTSILLSIAPAQGLDSLASNNPIGNEFQSLIRLIYHSHPR